MKGNNANFWVDILIKEIYDENKDKDGFLYISYAELETFGA